MLAQRAVMLNPGEAESYAWLANVYPMLVDPLALEQLSHARQLDPLHPPLWDFYIGRALLHVGQFRGSFHLARKVCAAGRDLWPLAPLHRRSPSATGEARGGRRGAKGPDSTRTYASISEIRRDDSYIDGIEFNRLIEGLREAGLPE